MVNSRFKKCICGGRLYPVNMSTVQIIGTNESSDTSIYLKVKVCHECGLMYSGD
jgi:hypothetical protein